MNLLVSACLLGAACRYNGTGCADAQVLALIKAGYTLFPVCPEQLGGLPTPRPPVELAKGRAVTCEGEDCTAFFERGAEETVRLAKCLSCTGAVLKSRSPSCGCGAVYDGTFSGRLVCGSGIAAAKLAQAGVSVFTEENCAAALQKANAGTD